MINRQLRAKIEKRIGSGKAISVIGPRQVGKTTLIKSILHDQQYLFLDADDPTTRRLLTEPNTEEIKNLIGQNKVVFIDEAQRVDQIGLTLKIIIDQLKDVQLFVSGSSAFELNSKINEPLTGRKWEYHLFPISWKEYVDHVGMLKSEQQLELRIIYGMYPEVINNQGSEVEVIRQLVSSYLYKDILALGGIRKPEILDNLLRALAYQMGNEVSYNELSQLIGVDKNTIGSYIDMLIKAFILFRLPSFSRNLRNEIKRNKKIYFYDTGIRNAIIGNFDPLDDRYDKGMLWENFLVSERIKRNNHLGSLSRSYFWRTISRQEVDYLEVTAGKVSAYEFKWNPKAKYNKPGSFMEAYDTDIKIVHRDNSRTFLLD